VSRVFSLLQVCFTVREFHRIEQRHQLLIRGVDSLLSSSSCIDSLSTAHVVAKNLDLRLEGAPELVLLERVVFLIVIQRVIVIVSRVPREIEKSGDESFLEICEAEVFGDLGDGVAEFDGELDGLLVFELFLPVLRCVELAQFLGW
jgi:hypothetical protein